MRSILGTNEPLNVNQLKGSMHLIRSTPFSLHCLGSLPFMKSFSELKTASCFQALVLHLSNILLISGFSRRGEPVPDVTIEGN